MSGNYILDGKKVVPCDDIVVWAKWYGKANCTVAETETGGIRVSTVFLGTDHGFGGGNSPLVFETMVRGPGSDDGESARYSTWEEAEAGHREMCRKVFGDNEVAKR